MKQEPSEKIVSALLKVLNGGIYVSDTLEARLLLKFVAQKSEVNFSSIEHLTNRQLEVFRLMGMGIKRKEIAEQLNLSISTIDNHVENIKKKMKFRDTNELRLNAFDFLATGKE
jgi:DNA-binding NarL/FixJ family response regulator